MFVWVFFGCFFLLLFHLVLFVHSFVIFCFGLCSDITYFQVVLFCCWKSLALKSCSLRRLLHYILQCFIHIVYLNRVNLLKNVLTASLLFRHIHKLGENSFQHV